MFPFLGTKLCFGERKNWVNCEQCCRFVSKGKLVDGETRSTYTCLCVNLMACGQVSFFSRGKFFSVAGVIPSLLSTRLPSLAVQCILVVFRAQHNLLSLEIGSVFPFANHSKKLKIIFVA